MRKKRVYKPRDRAAYFRAYRQRRGDALRALDATYKRAHYTPKPRLVRLRRATKAATDSYRAARYLSLEADLRARTAAELSAASLNPELARLIAEQARDDRTVWVKYDPEPPDCWRSVA